MYRGTDIASYHVFAVRIADHCWLWWLPKVQHGCFANFAHLDNDDEVENVLRILIDLDLIGI